MRIMANGGQVFGCDVHRRGREGDEVFGHGGVGLILVSMLRMLFCGRVQPALFKHYFLLLSLFAVWVAPAFT